MASGRTHLSGAVPVSGRRVPLLLVALVLLLAAAWFTPAGAQTLDRGGIGGTIRDESGAALPAVRVVLHHIDSGFERTVTSGGDGHFTGVLLPLGRYEVRAEMPGFAPATVPVVNVTLGQAFAIDLVMKVAGLRETVDVRATPSRAAAGVRTLLESAAIASLPSDGRDYRDFALLAPTARAISGTRGTFRLGGQPGDYLALHVDGADFTNNFFGEFFGSLETRNFTVPMEAVRQFQVTAGGLGAEAGRSNGGLVNVVTKSGTNDRRGSVAYFFRHHALAAKDAFGNAPTGLVRHQGGGSVGGPLARNRTFYLLAADLQRQETPITVKFARDVRGIGVPELGIADLAQLEGQFGRADDITTLFLKVDHALGPGHLLGSRANYTKHQGTNQGGGSTILTRATSNLESFENEGISWVSSLMASFGSRVVADTRFQLARENRPRAAQGEGPQIQISDTGSFGRSSVLPATQDMFRYETAGNLSVLAGRHTLKLGGNANSFNMRNNVFALALNGAYTFPTLERFLARAPSLYSQNFGLNGLTGRDAALLRSFWQHELAAYLQDEFRATPRLTLGVGLRYDAQFNPTPLAGTAGQRVPVGKPRWTGTTYEVAFAPVPQDIPDDLNNWAPRVEMVYDLDGRGRTILKGAAGLYYGRTPMIYFPVRGSGVTNSTIFAPPASFGVSFPQVLPDALQPGSALQKLVPKPAIQYVDPGFQNPRVLNANASVSRQVGSDWTVEVSALFSDARNLRVGGYRSTLWDRNLFPPARVDQFGRGIDLLAPGRPDPTITQANAMGSFGHGRYRAGVVQVRKVGGRWQFDASYALSKSEGNGSTERDTEALLGPSGPFDLEADWGVNELDQRHVFRSFLTVQAPHAVLLSSIVTAASGLAFPVYSPTDVNGDGVTNGGLNPDRVVLDGRPAPRFPYHQPSSFNWDLRVTKRFHLFRPGGYQLVLEVFNVLDTANRYSDPRTNAIAGQPNFRALNRTLGARVAQVGMRFDF